MIKTLHYFYHTFIVFVILIVFVESKDTKCLKDREKALKQAIPGRFIPLCNLNGYYKYVQFKKSECYCVDAEGVKLQNYHEKISQCATVDCNCARDEDAYEKTGKLGLIFSCKPNGNYESIQCLGSVCFCVDSQGQERANSSEVLISDIKKLKCD